METITEEEAINLYKKLQPIYSRLAELTKVPENFYSFWYEHKDLIWQAERLWWRFPAHSPYTKPSQQAAQPHRSASSSDL